MKRVAFLFFLFIGIFSLYFLLSPIKVSRKYTYQLNKEINLQEQTTNKNLNPDFYFNDDKDCYYFNLNGEVINHITAESGKFIKANKYFYAICTKEGDLTEIYSAKGDHLTVIKTYGYPYIPEEYPLLAMINLNGMGFSLYTINGELLIREIDFPSIITSISIDKSYNVLVSTLDGVTKYFSSNSKLIFRVDSENSRIKIAKSNCIDINGGMFAVCSGLYPEYIEIYNKSNLNIISRFKTLSNMRCRIFMKIIGDKLFYEGDRCIEYYDFKRNMHGIIKVRGVINEISINGNGNILVSTNDNNLTCLTVFTMKGNVLFFKEFNEAVTGIIFAGSNVFYFKMGNQVIKMQLGAS